MAEILAGNSPRLAMKFSEAVDRYWNEVGKHLKGRVRASGLSMAAENCLTDLERLKQYVTAKRSAAAEINDINDDFIAGLISWRRGQPVVRLRRVKGRKDLQQDLKAPLVSNATVNRSTTEVLKKVMNRARNIWNVHFEKWPSWKSHRLQENAERVRELGEGEGEALMQATRDDYAPAIECQHATGWRQDAVISLEWSQVNWGTKLITRKGKGGKIITTAINSELHALLWPLVGHHPKYVFTYAAKRTVVVKRAGVEEKLVKGKRYPLTESGFKSAWRRARAKAGLAGGELQLRNHDLRHDFATKMLRREGDLRKVSKALNHSNIKTTLRYAHVLDEEVHAAVAEQAKHRIRKVATQSPHNVPTTEEEEVKKALGHRGFMR